MNIASSKWASIMAMMALLLAVVAGVDAAPTGGPQIAPSSCGGIPVPPGGNAFCSFEGTGQGVIIGDGSCNVEGACLTIGDGVRIGNNSCNGDSACASTGGLFGEATSAVSIIGNRSCNGEEACLDAGAEGLSVIGSDSCNGGDAACLGAGQLAGASYIGNSACNNTGIGANHNSCLFVGSGADGTSGHIVVGNGSCNGSSACTFSGQFDGNSLIGNNACNGLGACFDAAQGPFPGFDNFQSASSIGNGSCNADSACQFAGINGFSNVGNTSCNNLFACEFAGSFNTGSSVGNHSCNGAPDLTDPDFPIGACDNNEGAIGNNKNN
jgi:hypothetical protein